MRSGETESEKQFEHHCLEVSDLKVGIAIILARVKYSSPSAKHNSLAIIKLHSGDKSILLINAWFKSDTVTFLFQNVACFGSSVPPSFY